MNGCTNKQLGILMLGCKGKLTRPLLFLQCQLVSINHFKLFPSHTFLLPAWLLQHLGYLPWTVGSFGLRTLRHLLWLLLLSPWIRVCSQESGPGTSLLTYPWWSRVQGLARYADVFHLYGQVEQGWQPRRKKNGWRVKVWDVSCGDTGDPLRAATRSVV